MLSFCHWPASDVDRSICGYQVADPQGLLHCEWWVTSYQEEPQKVDHRAGRVPSQALG
jgi:hypothetical protein